MALIHTHIHLKFFLRILKFSALLESKNLLLPKIAVMVLFMFSLNTLFEDYLAKFFGFHDLGLINDFLANTVHRGKIFYVSTLGVNHLSWHFSPTLFLITPFYLIFDSQFVFLVLNALAIYFSISLLSKLAFDVLKKNDVSSEFIWFAISAFVILTSLGTFTINVLGAGHFEVFYIPIVSLIFYFYCKSKICDG